MGGGGDIGGKGGGKGGGKDGGVLEPAPPAYPPPESVAASDVEGGGDEGGGDGYEHEDAGWIEEEADVFWLCIGRGRGWWRRKKGRQRQGRRQTRHPLGIDFL